MCIRDRMLSVETGTFQIKGVESLKSNEEIRIRKMVAISVSYILGFSTCGIPTRERIFILIV